MVDIERLLVAFLRAHTEVQSFFDESVYVEIPERAARPVCRVSQMGGESDNSAQPAWLNRPSVDFDVWAETKHEAFTGISTVRAALLAEPREQTYQGEEGELVYASATFPIYLPDSEWPDGDGRPGPRYHITTRMTAHPRRS